MSTTRKARTGLADLARTLPSDDHTASDDQPAENKLVQMALRVPLSLVEHLRRAAYWEPSLTLTSILERGARAELERLEALRGRAYPTLPEGEHIKRGRPIRSSSYLGC